MSGKVVALAVGSFAGFLALGDRYVISTLYTQLMANYHLTSYVVFSVLFSSFYVGYTIFQLPGGRIAQRFGPSKVIGISLISWSALFLVLPFTRSFGAAIGIAFFMGLAQGPVFPSIIFLLRLFYKDLQYARASGLLSAIVDVSPAIIPFLSFGLYYTAIGIKLPFILFGGIGLIAGTIVLLVRVQYTYRSERVSWTSLLGKRYLMFGLSFLIYDYFFYVIFTWYPLFLKARFAIETNNILYGVVPWVFSGLSGVLFGIYMDRINRDALMSEVSYAIVALTLVGMAISRSPLVFLVFVTVSLFFLGPPFLASWRQATRLGGENSSSFVGGWMNFWGNLGGIAAPIVVTTLKYHYGLSNVFLLSVIVPVLGLIAWVFMQRWDSSEK